MCTETARLGDAKDVSGDGTIADGAVCSAGARCTVVQSETIKAQECQTRVSDVGLSEGRSRIGVVKT